MIIEKEIGIFHAAYDTDSGEFISKSKRRFGKQLGWINDSGYKMIRFSKTKNERAHRIAWFFVYGVWPDKDIDHLNGDRKDNRISNLREATRSENCGNLRSAHADNSSGLLGVSIVKNKYFVARIFVKGKQINLGSFKTKEDAHFAYVEAKRKLHKMCEI